MFLSSPDELFPQPKPKRNNYFLRAKKAINKQWKAPENRPPISHKYYPSEFSYLCPRERVFQHFDPRPRATDKPSEAMRSEAGKAMHKYVQDTFLGPLGLLKGYWKLSQDCYEDRNPFYGYMPDEPCRFEEEKISNHKLLDDFPAYTNGKIDGKIGKERYDWLLDGMKGDPPEDGDIDYIWDFKFTSDRNYSSIKEAADLKDYYLLQQEVYQEMYQCPMSIFMFVNFSTWEYKFFEYESEGKLFQESLKTIREIEEGMALTVLPDTFACSDSDCSRAKSCPFKEDCFCGKSLAEILDENTT